MWILKIEQNKLLYSSISVHESDLSLTSRNTFPDHHDADKDIEAVKT